MGLGLTIRHRESESPDFLAGPVGYVILYISVTMRLARTYVQSELRDAVGQVGSVSVSVSAILSFLG